MSLPLCWVGLSGLVFIHRFVPGFFPLVHLYRGYKADQKLLFSMIFQNTFILDYPVEVANKGVLSSFTIKNFYVFQC